MEPTFIGILELVIGAIVVLAGSVRAACAFLMATSLLGGSAAILLPALGGSSIAPSQFALLFVWARILAPRGGYLGLIPEAIKANRWLLLFTAYGVAMAYIGPRLFAGAIDIFPMRFDDALGLIDSAPLAPTSQNVTASVFLIGAALTALASYLTCRSPGGAATIVSTAIALAWAHVLLGLAAALARGTPGDALFALIRNGTYSQLNDAVGDIARIRGVFAEASAYADFGFGYFVINAELWYRSIRPRATGAAALALAAVLFFSTSATAYVALAGYFAWFCLRAMLFPGVAVAGKTQAVMLTLFALAVATASAMIVQPKLVETMLHVVQDMTLGKSTSNSGVQRLFWARQGADAFVVSWGLGIGPGSFRSSSNITAILGAMGVIGIATYLLYLASVVQPGRRSTWGMGENTRQTIGGAFASAALLSIIPAAIASPHTHPETTFVILAGAAVALRPRLASEGSSEAEAERSGAPPTSGNGPGPAPAKIAFSVPSRNAR